MYWTKTCLFKGQMSSCCMSDRVINSENIAWGSLEFKSISSSVPEEQKEREGGRAEEGDESQNRWELSPRDARFQTEWSYGVSHMTNTYAPTRCEGMCTCLWACVCEPEMLVSDSQGMEFNNHYHSLSEGDRRGRRERLEVLKERKCLRLIFESFSSKKKKRERENVRL